MSVTAPPRTDEHDDRTLDERVAELEALIEEARQRARRRRRRNAGIALAVVLAAGAAVYAGGDGVRVDAARSADGSAVPVGALDRAGTWSVPTGPPGFSADVVLHPTKPGWLYLSAGGRVYRSTNSGRSWTSGPPIALKLDALAVDPRNGSILYAGTNDGVLKSTDAGRTWRRSGLRPTPGRSREYADAEGWVYSIAVDPADGRNVYAITRGLGMTVAFRSRDAGATWQAMRPSTPRDMKEIHAAGSGIVYTAGRFYEELPDGVQRSTNGGTTWRGVLDGSWTLAVDPDRAGTVWAVGEREVRVTHDGGTTWRSVGRAPADDVSAIVLDPRRPRTAYLTTGESGVFRTIDGGRTWRPFGAKARPGRGSRLTELLAVDPRRSGTLYAGDGLGIVASADVGATWRRADAGVVASQVSSIVPAVSNPTTIYTGGPVVRAMVGALLSRSDDRGRTWTALRIDGAGGAAWPPDGRSLAVDPHDHRHVLAGGRGGIIGSRDGGATWTSLRRLAPEDAAYAIVFAPSDPRQVYALAYIAAEERPRVIRSGDGGTTWKVQQAAGFETISAIAVHPTRAETVYATYVTRHMSPDGAVSEKGGVASSSDGGRSWRYRSIPADPGPLSLAFAPSDPNTLYVATFSGLARSVDGGDRWQLFRHPALQSFPVTIVVDPERAKTVYVGTGDHGVLRSTDGGVTLRPFGPRLPRQGVWSLALDPSGSRLYAGLGDAGLTSIRVR